MPVSQQGRPLTPGGVSSHQSALGQGAGCWVLPGQPGQVLVDRDPPGGRKVGGKASGGCPDPRGRLTQAWAARAASQSGSQNGRRGRLGPVSFPECPGRGRAPRARPRSLLAAQGCRVEREAWAGGSWVGWGAREEPERGAGRGTKGPFVERAEKRERITQCPGAMLVTREPFSASLGKQLGTERDRERVNPMGAGTGVFGGECHHGARTSWGLGVLGALYCAIPWRVPWDPNMAAGLNPGILWTGG